MLRTRPSRVFGALLAASLVAAAPAITSGTDNQQGPAPADTDQDTLPDDSSPYGLASQPAPSVTGIELVHTLEAFVTSYPNRTTGGLDELLASEFLAETAAGFGYETEVVSLPVINGLPGTGPIRAVTAFKQGTDLSDEVTLFIGHYDTLPQSLQGAYDNGTGTTMLLGLAESLSTVETRRSLMFAWYNGEEEGVLGSSRHVAKLKADGVQIEVVMGFDMVGIAFPVAVPTTSTCMCMWHGQDDESMRPILEAVNYEFLEYPAGPVGGAQIVGNNNRNSDERSFENGGAVTLRWAGLKGASTYPAYHKPDDTMATIFATAGSRENFELGMQHTLTSAYYTALALDTIDELGGSFND
jgi:hypothetical protein